MINYKEKSKLTLKIVATLGSEGMTKYKRGIENFKDIGNGMDIG